MQQYSFDKSHHHKRMYNGDFFDKNLTLNNSRVRYPPQTGKNIFDEKKPFGAYYGNQPYNTV